MQASHLTDPSTDAGRSARVTLVRDEDDRPGHVRYALELGHVLAGTAAVDITPGTRSLQQLSLDLLDGLGKRSDLRGNSSTQYETWFRAGAWVLGEQITELVVCRAHLLDRFRWERLIEIASLVPTRLWLLVHAARLSRSQREAVRDWAIPNIAFPEFKRLTQSWAGASTPASVEPQLARIPDEEFPLFLARCRALLAEDDFERVAQLYWRVFRAVEEKLGGTALGVADAESVETARQCLRERLGACSRLPEMLVTGRAVQSAAFRHGVLVKLNERALAGSLEASTTSDLDGAASEALRLCAKPRDAALGAIALAGRAAPSELVRLNVGSIAAEGAYVNLGGRQVDMPPHARGLVRAHLAYRLGEGASPEDPLFVSEKRRTGGRRGREFGRTTRRSLHQRLTELGTEIGLSLVALEDYGAEGSERLLQRQGITVHRLPSGREAEHAA